METILIKEVKPFGTGAHLIINREYLGMSLKIVIPDKENTEKAIQNP